MHIGANGLAKLRSRLGSLTLLQRFALTGGGVMIISMLLIGQWVTSAISGRVVENTAAATALFMDSFIAPLAQELDTADALSIGPIRAMEEMLAGSAFGQRVVSIKIWKPGGLIAYADDSGLIGQSYPPSESLTAAFEGRLRAGLTPLGDLPGVVEGVAAELGADQDPDREREEDGDEGDRVVARAVAHWRGSLVAMQGRTPLLA